MKTRKLIKALYQANLKHNVKEIFDIRKKIFKKSLKGKHTGLAD